MVVELGHTCEVRQARTPAIRASFLGSCGRAAMLNWDVRARRQAPPQAKLRHSLTAPPEAGFGDEREARQRLVEGGRDSLFSSCARMIVYQNQNRKRRGAFRFWDGGEGGTTGRGRQTRARAKEPADWVKAIRRPWKTAARRHTETNDRRVHHQEGSNHRFFPYFFTRQQQWYVPVVYATGLCGVGALYALHGE